jgi:hypothetical protein
VTEASSTGVLESFALLTPNLTEVRNVPADNGIYYAICPPRASCPYPADRFARPAADVVSRRMALELVLRTFLETSADVVAVSLPTPRFIALIVERTELAREIDFATLSASLRDSPAGRLSASLEGIVDRLTRPRIYVGMWLDPTPSGGIAWVGMLRWRT